MILQVFWSQITDILNFFAFAEEQVLISYVIGVEIIYLIKTFSRKRLFVASKLIDQIIFDNILSVFLGVTQ